MKQATIICHSEKTEAIEAAKVMSERLSAAGISVCIPEAEAAVLGLPELARDHEACINSDMIFVFGGDGTILRTVRWLDGADIPIIGINLGRFGFLAGSEITHLDSLIENLRERQYLEQRRMLLQYQILKEGVVVTEGHVLNEVVLGRGAQSRVARLTLTVNGEHFIDYAADGVIASSPTGSTAYALSAGGPIVSPDCRLIIVTPVCPHTLFNRSVVFASEDVIQVQTSSPIGISADGQDVEDIEFDLIRITASPRTVRLVQLHENAFYRLLRDKLRINQPLYYRT